LAQRAVAHWKVSSSPAPFDLDDPDHLNAFHHGAVGPDLGYFPGGARVLSELSHCVRTGRLTRTLIRSARTPIERAYAWGWLTHVIGDRDIHPLIGRAVGEIVEGSRDVFVDGSSDPLTHLRVELGLDCWFAARRAGARSVRLRPSFDETSIAFLERAYAATYGVAIPRETFLASHRSAGRRAGQSLSTLWIVGGLMDQARGTVALCGLRRLLRAAYRSSALRGYSLAYVNPVSPSPWLLDAVGEAIPRHTRDFLAHWKDGAERVEDWNLDTGRRLAEEDDHPGTLRALESLGRLLRDAGRSLRPTARAGASGPHHRTGAPEGPGGPLPVEA
jgi:hypothetical protein